VFLFLSAPTPAVGVRFAQSRDYIILLTRRTHLRADGYAGAATNTPSYRRRL